jgi:hypothetical protein
VPSTESGAPVLYERVAIPEPLLTTGEARGETHTFGGDIRMGDLDGDGRPEFVVYRAVDNMHDGGGAKPCFMGAFDMDGTLMWRHGDKGLQPQRPMSVIAHDLDQDGAAEVVCFWHDPTVDAEETTMADVVLQVRDGKTGEVLRQAAPPELTRLGGKGANAAHQRILAADFRGTGYPRDFLVKVDETYLAFTDQLDVLWTYETEWTEYTRCPAYIPAVGDIDGDGRDEVNAGYFLLDSDGAEMWKEQLGRNMDSVAIAPWDGGAIRAICSGFGHVMDAEGNKIVALGEDLVPHGQEVRVARFLEDDPHNQMVIRYKGHTPDVMVVNTAGEVVKRFAINPSPNNTGMEAVYWNGPGKPALLYNGGMLWDVDTETAVALPGLPEPKGGRMGWYHCIPADVCGDAREEVVLYNPWDRYVYVYSPAPVGASAFNGYTPGPRQYNVRLMD